MKILVLGGDGFTGWPLSLKLSQIGHEVVVVDNFSRRKIDAEIGTNSLTPIQPLGVRIAAWKAVSGLSIDNFYLDIESDYLGLLELIRRYNFDTVVHLAEQKSAPYSMKSSYHKRRTIAHNMATTSNLLCALIDANCDAHVVHLGTMGVYGYGTIDAEIPEGYLDVKVQDHSGAWQSKKILYPPGPGSIYHMTKCMDHIMLAFFAKNDKLRCTDLHQGIVWGTQTDETSRDERLINRFDYDSDYGTVLNRFLAESATGVPLTVYGTGEQTRAFIHLKDSVECMRLAIENPPERNSRVAVFNQAAETKTLAELADLVSNMTGASVKYYSNPRAEASSNTLAVKNAGLRSLGWSPILLDESLCFEVVDIAKKYAHYFIKSVIPPLTAWRSDIELDQVGTRKSPIEKANQS